MAESEKNESKSTKQEVYSFGKTVIIFIVAVIFLRASVVEAFKIPSGSMKPTLMIGDHIIVSKFNYGIRFPFVKRTVTSYSIPERGDVVVFTRPDDRSTPENESKINIIKRVIGIPGDTVQVLGKEVLINDKVYDEPHEVWWEEGGLSNFGPVTVPEGHIFLLGDNRDHSKDSRFWRPSPFLDAKLVKGRALFIYWSFDSFKRIGRIIY